MKASELRIGNLVRLKSKAKVWEILSGQEIDTGCDSEDFEPLKIEEHWLIRFGFKNKRKADYVNCDFCEYNIQDFVWLDNDSVEFCGNVITSEIKYVHQIQNLYFAIFGEELVLQD